MLHRLDNAPAVHRGFTAHEECGVTGKHAGEQFAVRRQIAGTGLRLQSHCLQSRWITRTIDVQLDAEKARIHANVQPIRLVIAGESRRQALRPAEGDDDFLLQRAQRFGCADTKGNARPAPCVDLEHDLGKRLRAALGIDAGLVGVRRHGAPVDPPGRIASAASRAYGVIVPDACRAQHLCFRVAEIASAEGARRIHGKQRENLERVTLNHVHQRTGAVVVAGASLEGEAFVEDDIHALDVLRVENRLNHAVGETQAKDVEHGGHPEVMVHAIYLLFRHEPRDEVVEHLRTCRARTEGLLEDESCALRQADVRERAACLRRDLRWEGEIQDRASIACVEEAAKVALVCRVGLQVAGASQHRAHFGTACLDARERFVDSLAPSVIVMLLGGAPEEGEISGSAAGQQSAEAGEEQSPREVTARAQDEQSLMTGIRTGCRGYRALRSHRAICQLLSRGRTS